MAFDKLNSVREKVKEENVCDEEYLGLLLDYAGKAYYAQVDVETRLLAERMDVHTGRALSVGMTGYRPIFAVDVAGNKSLTGEGSLFIDIDYDARTIASGCENAEEFSLASGMISSVYESIIWEQLSGTSSVSSMSILGDAVEDGEEIYILTKSNLAEKKAELELNKELLSEIEKEIQEDKIVIITGNERTYGDWQGAGYIVLDSESLTGEYMISGGLNGGSMDTRVDNAYLLNMIILGIDVIQICGMIHGIVNAVLACTIVGALVASVLTIAMVGLIVLAAQLYLEFTQMLLDYYSGDMEAGEDLILSSRINLVCELLFCFGGKAVGSVVAKSAGKSILTTFGDDIGKQLINKFGDSQTLWKYVKKLRNLGFTDDAIQDMALTLDPGSVAKLAKLSGKGLSKGLVESLAGNEAAIKKVTNVSDLKIFNATQRSWDDIVMLLGEKGDEFIRVYRSYGDDVVDVLNKCGSDSIVNVDLYKQAFIDMVLSHGDEYLRLYQRYGQPVTEKCIIYADELFEIVTSYGDDFVEYVITYGDSIMEGIRVYGDDFVIQLTKHKDTFAHLYTLYGDEAYKVFIAHSDELMELAVSNTDEAIELVVKYGDEVLQGIQKHGDDFMKKYADEGEEFIEEYLNKGDEVFEGGLRAGMDFDEVTAYLKTLDFQNMNVAELNQYLNKVENINLGNIDVAKLQTQILQDAGFANFDIKGNLADITAFKRGTIRVEEMDADFVLYRRGYPTEGTGGYGYGQWWSDTKFSIEEAREQLAILESWGNPLTGEYEMKVPQGTRAITGIAEAQAFYDEISGELLEYRGGGAKQYWFNSVDSSWVK